MPHSNPFGAREAVVRRVRQRRILAAFYPLQERQFEGNALGDSKKGHYEAHDGSVSSFVVQWDATGVVALAWDRYVDHEDEWSKPEHARNPGKHLEGVPPAMRALAARACDHGERLATEGFWIEAGPEASFGPGRSSFAC